MEGFDRVRDRSLHTAELLSIGGVRHGGLGTRITESAVAGAYNDVWAEPTVRFSGKAHWSGDLTIFCLYGK